MQQLPQSFRHRMYRQPTLLSKESSCKSVTNTMARITRLQCFPWLELAHSSCGKFSLISTDSRVLKTTASSQIRRRQRSVAPFVIDWRSWKRALLQDLISYTLSDMEATQTANLFSRDIQTSEDTKRWTSRMTLFEVFPTTGTEWLSFSWTAVALR